ncbi:MAG: hypothetical protein KDK66_01500 [Deltaproteobacteria bacterium]|nr:hypothetical protein [Deltaproteobacteria bacterium]
MISLPKKYFYRLSWLNLLMFGFSTFLLLVATLLLSWSFVDRLFVGPRDQVLLIFFGVLCGFGFFTFVAGSLLFQSLFGKLELILQEGYMTLPNGLLLKNTVKIPYLDIIKLQKHITIVGPFFFSFLQIRTKRKRYVLRSLWLPKKSDLEEINDFLLSQATQLKK